MADIVFRNEGTIWLATPLTAAASEWIAEHISEESQWFGPSLVIEHRFVETIATALVADGLEIEE
jgi:hypothetical protein